MSQRLTLSAEAREKLLDQIVEPLTRTEEVIFREYYDDPVQWKRLEEALLEILFPAHSVVTPPPYLREHWASSDPHS